VGGFDSKFENLISWEGCMGGMQWQAHVKAYILKRTAQRASLSRSKVCYSSKLNFMGGGECGRWRGNGRERTTLKFKSPSWAGGGGATLKLGHTLSYSLFSPRVRRLSTCYLAANSHFRFAAHHTNSSRLCPGEGWGVRCEGCEWPLAARETRPSCRQGKVKMVFLIWKWCLCWKPKRGAVWHTRAHRHTAGHTQHSTQWVPLPTDRQLELMSTLLELYLHFPRTISPLQFSKVCSMEGSISVSSHIDSFCIVLICLYKRLEVRSHFLCG
jgi:hypothetical protein